MKDLTEITKTISLLYELSLAIGTSLDTKENCTHFLNILIRRMNLAYAAVWLYPNHKEEKSTKQLELIYGYPKFRIVQQKIEIDDSLNQKFARKPFIILDAETENFLKIDQKTEDKSILYRLGNLGFLNIYAVSTSSFLDTVRLHSLKDVMSKFTHSLQACLAYETTQEETNRRLEAQKSLALSEEKYRSVVRNIAEGLLITDLESNIIFTNDRMYELTGFSHEELRGKRGYELLVSPIHRNTVIKKHTQRLKGIAEQYELPLKHKNGTTTWVSIRATPYLDGQGKIIGSLAAFIDITDKKIAENKILESQKKLQLILDTSLDAIIIVDSKSFVTDWNHNAERIFGHSKSEAVGKPLSGLIIPPRMRAAHQKGMSHYMATGEGPVLNQRIELPALRKSGEEFTVELSISPIRIGDDFFFSAFIRDISKRKANENALIQAKQSAEQSRQAERQFLAHMSHEIRTPMNAVIGMTHLLMNSGLTDIQLEYVEALKFSGDSLMSIISDVLDLSKIEAGEFTLEKRPFSIQQLIHNLQRTYQINMQDKNISVMADIDKNIKNQVIGDKTRLNQILTNLLGNASKFTEEGYIGINAKLDKKEEDTYWINFEVYDTGIGIAQEDLEHIFKSFKQVEDSNQNQISGTGLGLSIVQQLIELHHGEISVQSELGKGSTFSLRIPYQDSGIPIQTAQTSESDTNEDLVLRNQLNILVAEDHPINQKLISTFLEEWGAEYYVVSNGEEAIEASQKYKYDCILMDINMPKMNGFEATKLIRKDPNNLNTQTPIIALTAAALKKEEKRMLKAGANDFITKPFSPKQLRLAIKNSLAQSEQMMISSDKKNIENQENTQTTKEKQQLLDLSYLKRFSRGNSAFVIEMLKMFLEENPKNIKELQDGLKNENWELLRMAAHKMKSSYRAMGMIESAELSEQLEHATKEEILKPSLFENLVKQIVHNSTILYQIVEDRIATGNLD